MRRAIGEKPAVARAGTRFRLATLAIALAVIAPPGARGDGPPPNQPDGRASADNGAAAGPPADPAVRRADARPHDGLGSALLAGFRHLQSSACLRRAYAAVAQNDPDRTIAECTEAIRLDPGRGILRARRCLGGGEPAGQGHRRPQRGDPARARESRAAGGSG